MDTIFISSTFQDMQFERDAIQSIVLPRLNATAHEYGQSVSFCDLRWGINTKEMDEENMNRKVLEVCLDEIDRSNPPMVVILGERYGWIPPGKLIKELSDYKEITLEDYEISATALEIEYGSFAKQHNTLFYFRSIEGNAPNDSYFSEDVVHKEKLDVLKKKVSTLAGEKLTTYTIHFDNGKASVQDIQAFAEMLSDDLLKILIPKWKQYVSMSPLMRERLSHWQFVQEKDTLFCARQGEVDQIIDDITKGKLLTVIKGQSGSGKSTLYGKIALELDRRYYSVIPISCGLTSKTTTAFDILKYEVLCLEDMLEGYDYAARNQVDQETKEVWITRLEAACSEYANQYDEPLCIMVDAVDQLIPDGDRDDTIFIPRTLSNKIRFLMTSLPEFTKYSEMSYQLGDLSQSDSRKTVNSILSHHRKEMPESVIDAVISRTRNPLAISFIIQRLLMMDLEDFEAIKNKGGGIDAITDRQLQIINNMPSALQEMCVEVIKTAGKVINPGLVRSVSEYIAISRYGLRDTDLAALLGKTWNYLDFVHFINLINENIIIRTDGRYDFMHKSIRQGIVKTIDDQSIINDSIYSAFSRMEDYDPIRQSEIIYHGIKAGEYEKCIYAITEYMKAENQRALELAAENMHFLCVHGDTDMICDLIEMADGEDINTSFLEFVFSYLEDSFEFNVSESREYVKIATTIKAMLDKKPKDSKDIQHSLYWSKYYNSSLSVTRCKQIGDTENAFRLTNDYYNSMTWLFNEGYINKETYAGDVYRFIHFGKNLTLDENWIDYLIKCCKKYIDEGIIEYLPDANKGMFYGCLGELYTRIKDYDNTLKVYLKDLSLRQKAADRNPAPDIMMHLSGGYANVGLAYSMLDQWQEALKYYERCDEIVLENKELSNVDYSGFDYYLNMAQCCKMLYYSTKDLHILERAYEYTKKSILQAREYFKRTQDYREIFQEVICDVGEIAAIISKDDPSKNPFYANDIKSFAERILIEDSKAFNVEPTNENRNEILRMYIGFINAAFSYQDYILLSLIIIMCNEYLIDPMIENGDEANYASFATVKNYINASAILLEITRNTTKPIDAMCEKAFDCLNRADKALKQYEATESINTGELAWIYALIYEKKAFILNAKGDFRAAVDCMERAIEAQNRTVEIDNSAENKEILISFRNRLEEYQDKSKYNVRTNNTHAIVNPDFMNERRENEWEKEHYSGELVDGKRQGIGIYEWDNGAGKYHGSWVDDLREGYGETIFPNGSKYYGEWKKGKPDGFGIKTMQNGKIKCGMWKAGDLYKEMPAFAVKMKLSNYPNYGLR